MKQKDKKQAVQEMGKARRKLRRAGKTPGGSADAGFAQVLGENSRIEHLNRVPHNRGVEVDIRDYDGALRLCHDPFTRGEEFEEYLKHYNHSMIILNVKCDGLEDYVLSLMRKYDIRDYFFLDVTNPSLVRLAMRGIRDVAVRYSEFEPIESALALAGISLSEAEKQLIANTLKMVNGNRTQAAKILGIGERTLYRKIKEYGLK